MTNKETEHFNKINALSTDEWKEKCVACNDCSKCNMALHKDLFSTTKHTCIYDMSLAYYQIEIDHCEAYIA
jgi:hypothetical protein